ncbi:glycosyltransferase family 4 protein [Thermococcus indicus]|uniref:Glycosyltransferase family 4 protein n=1 Tax=Thermococcus indicus TaxID=2586643 RepID=A0A4Y5SKX2_9EURY|nr:glycosyltransferase family 4 protein [Thermococcus indicus]QDA30610.1 glycosyltransferase family 4 protein [Thermococcus indicus]
MKLLVIVNDFPNEDNSYGANIFVKEQLKAIQKFVDEINVVVPLPRGIELKRKTSYQNYIIGHKIHVHFVKYNNPLFPLAYSKLKDEWIWVESRAVSKFIKKKGIEFDLIHAHYSWPSGAVAVRLKEEFGVPVVITEHTHITLRKMIERKDRTLKWTWKNTDALIRVNKRDIPLIKEFCPSLKVYHIPNGYNQDRIRTIPKSEARKKLGLSQDVKILFNLARLLPYKGHRYLIDAMSIVVKERDDIVCFIGGSGPLKEKLQEQINKLGLQEHVKLLGFVPDDQLALWVNAADLFVLPSLSESFGIVQIEAMAVGIPVVATINGGSEEVITSEDYGLLCPPKDPECLAEKILIALEKEWDREKIRKYARQFTWENIAKKVLEVYKEVILQ